MLSIPLSADDGETWFNTIRDAKLHGLDQGADVTKCQGWPRSRSSAWLREMNSALTSGLHQTEVVEGVCACVFIQNQRVYKCQVFLSLLENHFPDVSSFLFFRKLCILSFSSRDIKPTSFVNPWWLLRVKNIHLFILLLYVLSHCITGMWLWSLCSLLSPPGWTGKLVFTLLPITPTKRKAT